MSDNLIEASSVAQDEFDQAEALTLALIRESYPTLDLRRGTALRDLLVRPASAMSALESRRYAELQRTRSLLDIVANPGANDAEYINAVLANFNTSLRAGTKSTGVIKIQVRNPGAYRLAAGTQFQSSDGALFSTVADVFVRDSDGTLSGPDADGYLYFSAQVESVEDGATTVTYGEAFTPVAAFSGYVSASAYSTFVDGRPTETAEEALARLPVTVASRGLGSRASIESALTDPSSSGYNPAVRAVSVQGAGDESQLRDRANIHGIPLGGKVDVYVRTFGSPEVVTLIRPGTLNRDGTYRIHVPAGDAPGVYAVRSVNTPDAVLLDSAYATDGMLTAGSLAFSVVRTRETDTAPANRFSPSDSVAGTVYQGLVIDVEAAGVESPMFKLELYAASDIIGLQNYVDRKDVKSLGTDVLVRAPFVCAVSLRMPVRVPAGVTLDTDGMRAALRDAVNAASFRGRLTTSELIAVAHQFSIQDVNTAQSRKGGIELRGSVVDGAGVTHMLTGSELVVDNLDDQSGLLGAQTCVFSTSLDRITVEVTAA